MKIPILDLAPEINARWNEFNEAIQGVLRSGHFIMGPQVKEMETEFAKFLGVKHAIGLNSGTDALIIGLRALGIGAGDEVITSSFSFFATAEAVSLVGAKPVFVDIDPKTFNLDPAKIEAKITPKTKAIIPVHLFGNPADMESILAIASRHKLAILEDVAQATGASISGKKVGGLGNLGAFSFFPSKNLGGFGDGGMVVTNDDNLAASCAMLRTHGSKKKYYNETIGYNSRLDEIQAACLRIKLRHLQTANEGRRKAATRYAELLKPIAGVTTPTDAPASTHVYHQYTIRIDGGRRDMVHDKLAAAGIGTMIYYPVPIHRLPVYDGKYEGLAHTEKAAEQVISLPIWPEITMEIQTTVADAIAEALKG